MSWSISLAGVDETTVREEFEKAQQVQLDNAPFDSWDEGVEKQMAVALDAAEQALKTNAIHGKANVSLSGHSRLDERQADSLSIGLYGYVPPPPPAPAKK